MPSFSGKYQHETRGTIEVEFSQRDGGQRWHVVVKNGMTRRECSTWQPDPWGAVRELVGSVLDAAQGDDSEPPLYDLNQKLPRQVSSTVRRRGERLPSGLLPSGLPPWTPPTD
jgi:hypothetical protein